DAGSHRTLPGSSVDRSQIAGAALFDWGYSYQGGTTRRGESRVRSRVGNRSKFRAGTSIVGADGWMNGRGGVCINSWNQYVGRGNTSNPCLLAMRRLTTKKIAQAMGIAKS